MRAITVRIQGTACLVDRRSSSADPFQKRVILPFDDVYDPSKPEQRHIPYVEFPDTPIKSGKSNLSDTYKRTGSKGLLDYRRYELSNHVISIENVHDGTALTVMQSYSDHVPQMKNKVLPGLDDRPRDECFDAAPDGAIMTGFFDISHGILKAGTYFEFVTRFVRKSGQVTGYKVQTPVFVELLVPITSEDLVVTMTAGEVVVRVVMDSTADLITIGNQPEKDILGTGSGEDVAHHFLMYYNLADDPPSDPVLPVKEADPVNGCSNTNWP